jgi:hypothetical protein
MMESVPLREYDVSLSARPLWIFTWSQDTATTRRLSPWVPSIRKTERSVKSRDGIRWRRGRRGDGIWHRVYRLGRRGEQRHDDERSLNAAEIGLLCVVLF